MVGCGAGVEARILERCFNCDVVGIDLEEPQLRPGKNMIYHYANGLAGVKMRDGENVYGVMFVSLDNPPNIHKLPEDLSVYVYMNQPIFSNSGSYSYEKDRDRAFILSGESQNGPKFLNSKITQ